MKKIIFAIFTLSLLFNISQGIACDGDHAETKPAGDQGPVKKGK